MAIETAYATAHDKADWLPLWQAYLAFYKNPLPDDVTDLTFARFLDDREQMVLLVARDGDQMVGFRHRHPASFDLVQAWLYLSRRPVCDGKGARQGRRSQA